MLIEYHNTGMKLKALDNHCYLKFPNHNEFCKIVIAEPTKNSGKYIYFDEWWFKEYMITNLQYCIFIYLLF